MRGREREIILLRRPNGPSLDIESLHSPHHAIRNSTCRLQLAGTVYLWFEQNNAKYWGWTLKVNCIEFGYYVVPLTPLPHARPKSWQGKRHGESCMFKNRWGKRHKILLYVEGEWSELGYIWSRRRYFAPWVLLIMNIKKLYGGKGWNGHLNFKCWTGT